MFPQVSSSTGLFCATVLCLLAASGWILCQAKPLAPNLRSDPTAGGQRGASRERLAAAATENRYKQHQQQVHYLIEQPQQVVANQVVYAHQPQEAGHVYQQQSPNSDARQEVYYLQRPAEPHAVEREYVQVDNVAPQAGAISVSHEAKHTYPGEIIYLGENTEVLANYGENTPAGEERDQRAAISKVAGSVSQSSGLPATILTEIPVKDMPEEGK